MNFAEGSYGLNSHDQLVHEAACDALFRSCFLRKNVLFENVDFVVSLVRKGLKDSIHLKRALQGSVQIVSDLITMQLRAWVNILFIIYGISCARKSNRMQIGKRDWNA